jgi:fimbrial chaperone protein
MNVLCSLVPPAWLRCLLLVFSTPALVWAPPAEAGAFSISPVRIHMTPRERVVAVSITNEGETEVALQADVYTWEQSEDGTDALKPTEELLLAPPIIRLAPKARQVVRLALLRPADPERQLTYRLIVREVPELTQPKDQTLQVPITLALSMPVFITPPNAKRRVECEVQRPEAQVLGARCANLGNAYAQVRGVIFRRDETELARFEGGAYVLPGAHKFMRVESGSPPPPGAAQMDIQFDDGTVQSQSVNLP